MSNRQSKIEEFFPYYRPLKDLPANKESTFMPYNFISRKFLINFKKHVKKEFQPYILVPPDDVAFYESNGYYRRAVTWSMVMERRKKIQKDQLKYKRSNWQLVEEKPLYIWVFFCPGISKFFRGNWLYFKGLHEYRGGGIKGSIGGKLLDKVIKLFPLVEVDIFGNYDFELWKKRFVKKYSRGSHAGKKQGLALVWAKVRGENVIDILRRIE